MKEPIGAKASKDPSCIKHERQYRFFIWGDLVDLFDGDTCAAALIGILEFATNGEIGRLRLAEEDGDPWVKASVSSLHTDLLGLYSERAIHERLSWLKELELLTSQSEGRGKINRYLLDGVKVSEFLRLRKVLPKPDCKIADEGNDGTTAKLTAKLTAKTTANGGVLNLKEKELRTENKEEPFPSLPAEENLDLEDDLEVFLSNSSRRSGGPRIKFGRKQDGPITERVIASEEKHGKREFRLAWMRFLPYCKANAIDAPLGYFLASIERWLMAGETKAAEPETFERVQLPSPPADFPPIILLPAETIETFLESKPPRFRHFIGLFLVSGKELTLPRVRMAWAKWQLLTEEQREGTIRAAERKFPKTAPEYISSPDRFIDGEPWTSVQIDRAIPAAPVNGKLDVSAEARRISHERAAARRTAQQA